MIYFLRSLQIVNLSIPPMPSKPFDPKKSPKYRKPPVIEVAMGVTFEKLENFKLPHTGLFWEKVKEEFPTVDHAASLDLSVQSSYDKNTGFPLPRIWFINKTTDKLIQLQNNRFYFNWRTADQKPEYPSYENIKKEFQTKFNIFKSFIKELEISSINLLECELSYINHIPKGKGWNSLNDIKNIFPNLIWRQENGGFLPEPIDIFSKTDFPFPENKGFLTLKIQKGIRNIDGLPILIFENIAKGLGEDKTEKALWDWFEMAHDWIVRGFADVTDMTIQKNIWERYQ